jgi:hypothetical protein
VPDPLHHRVRPVIGEVSEFQFDLGQIGNDIQRHAAMQPPHVQRRMGNAKGRILRPLVAMTFLQRTDGANEVGCQVQSVDEFGGLGRMTGPPPARRMHGGLALVTDDESHRRRFADDANSWRADCRVEMPDHVCNAAAPDLFVVRDSQFQGLRQPGSRCFVRGVQHASEKTLHVRRTATIQPPVPLAQAERIGRPVLAFDRHHIGVR